MAFQRGADNAIMRSSIFVSIFGFYNSGLFFFRIPSIFDVVLLLNVHVQSFHAMQTDLFCFALSQLLGT